MRADRPVELPAPADLVEGRAGAGRRRHDGRQAVTGHAVDDDPPRQAPRGGRRPEGRREPRARAGQPRRTGARRESRRRPRVVHRQPRRRQVDHGRGCRQREAGRARARRQESEHRVRRRRLRDRGGQRADRRVPAQRPGLLGRLPADRRGQHPRPVRRGAGAARGSHPAGPRDGRSNRDRRPDLGRPSRSGRALHRTGGVRGGSACRGRQPPDRSGAPGRLLPPADGVRRLHART